MVSAEQCECWVQCCRRACGKWRKLPDSTDLAALPEDWTCSHNTDAMHSRCEAPEESWSGGEDSAVYSDLVPGSIVWARQCGFPWWPAMVDQDPDTGNCFLFKKESDKEPLKCHLTYFGKPATRAWVSVSMIKSFQERPETGVGAFQKKGGQRDCSKKVKEAVKIAKAAQKLGLKKRLSQFGFRARYDEEERLSSEDSDTAEVLGIFLTDSSRRGERCSLSDEEHRPKPSKKRKKTLSKGKDLSLGKAWRERKEKKGGKVSEEKVKSKSEPRFGTKENKPLEISAHKAPVRKFALPKTRDQRVPGGERSPDSRRGEAFAETGAPPDPEQETLYSFTWSKTSSQAAELQKRAGEEGEGEAGESPEMGQGEGVQEEESITLVLRGEGGSEVEEGSEREEEGSINKAVLGYPVQDKGFDTGGGGGQDLPMFSEDDEDEDMEILTCRQAVETALEEEEDFSLYLFEEE
ncbi:hypothetical protein AOXY_G30232 [Acipenser oxyrinchus oxyrinchus]|uniref:Zinc finger CW-type PWWP domain protein 1 n=1 Tax=Acipenser oxyrinchus oxyrinchus TaxID=40147 RepID=A0AAD8FQC9_ACIOX|nr:hypothetical protein AOXY_G30232 [Acipenser oxyrinchus oxyrinchus]